MTDAAVVWKSRALRLALAAFPVWCTVSLLLFNAPWRFRLLVTGLFALTAVAPHAGLVAIAAFVPLGRLMQIGLGLQPFRLTEAMVLAFFAGWLARPRSDHDGPRVPATPAWLLALILCASVVAQMWSVASIPGELPDNLRTLYQAYFLVPDRIGFGAAALALEGLGLMAATATLFRARPRLANALPIAMVSSAVVAAAASVLLQRGIAFAPILDEHALVVGRTSAHVGDPNAAASYFGMMLFVAAGMAARKKAPLHALWAAGAGMQVAGLWLAASRTGSAVVVLGVAAAVVFALTATWRPRMRGTAIAAMLVLVVAGGMARAWTLRADPGASFRQQFFATSFRMIADRPVLGLGVGRYYEESALFLSPEMAWTYAFQNAHNYFLQVAAEIGLVGVALLLAVLGLVVFRAMRAISRRPGDMRLLGCAVGVGVMLTTWLTGHPLLLPEVAFPFWILLGLLAGLSGSVLIATGELSRKPEAGVGAVRVALVVLVAIVALWEIGLGRRPLQPSAFTSVTGLEPWESDADGARFRWTHEYASLFVPANATRVYIPVRLPVDVPRLLPMTVDVEVGAVYRGRTLVGKDWAILNLELPPGRPLQRFKRIDLKIQRTWQPAVYIQGSSDLRKVGVQVGEIKEFYEY
jgi:O-antigen ligase